MNLNKRRILAVFPNDPIKAYYKKGEIKERYYNPCNFFDEVHIISPCNSDVEESKVQTIAGDAKLKIHPIGRFSLVSPFHRYKALRLIKEIKPDVIRAYNPQMQGYFAVYCGKKLKIPTVISLHNEFDDAREYDKSLILRLFRLFEYQSLSNADKVICVTNYLISYAKKYGAKDIEVIYNRVNTKQFNKSDGAKKFNKHTILCIGRLDKQKYQECLIRAIKNLNVDLLLIGDGELYDGLKQLTKELGIEDRVKFIKSVPHSEIHKYYSSADIFAIATHYEGFCIPVLEAMASSLPVVASKIGPIQELVGNAGILIENTPEAFKEAFKKLISNPELRKELGEKGRKRALEVDGKIMEEKERRLYEGLAENYSTRYVNDTNPDDQWKYLEEGPARHLHRLRMNFLIEKLKNIKKELSRNIKILDAGCGDGVITSYIASICKENDEIIGVDLNQIRLKRAEKNCPNANFVLGNITKLGFPNNSFDIIVLHHVIEHIPDDENVLKECYRVLKDDGYLIMGIPNEGDIMGELLRKIHKKTYKEGEHVNFYSSESMKCLLKENGFNCIENKGFGFIFPFFPIHYLILRNKLLFSIGNWLTQKLKFTADSLFFVARKKVWKDEK